MIDELVRSGDVLILVVLRLIADILVHGGHRPQVLVQELLMDADLVRLKLRLDVKALMIDEIPRSVRGGELRVMSGRPLSDLVIEGVVADQLYAVLVAVRLIVCSVLPRRIEIRARHVLRPEETHIVAAICGEPAVCAVQIVVAALRIIGDIGSLAGLVVAADEVDAEIAVHEIAGDFIDTVRSGIDCLSGFRIELQKEHAARPGPVDHIEPLSIRIEEHRRIDRIRRVGVIPASVLIEPVVAHLIDAAVRSAFLNELLKMQVVLVPGRIPCTFAVRLAVLRESGVHNGIPEGIGTADLLSHEKSYGGAPPGRGCAHIEHICALRAVLPHIKGIVDDVRSPYGIAAGVGVMIARPLKRLLKRLRQSPVERQVLSAPVIKIQLLPRNEIIRGGDSRMGTEYIECAVLVFKNGGIMHADMNCRRHCLRFTGSGRYTCKHAYGRCRRCENPFCHLPLSFPSVKYSALLLCRSALDRACRHAVDQILLEDQINDQDRNDAEHRSGDQKVVIVSVRCQQRI